VLIVIDDDGPGLSPTQRLQAMKRGQRLDETAPGSGLGLSIVNDTVEIYGGTFAMEDSDWGGLSARLDLPGGVAETED
jgi:signal transduction histidine kinase